MTKPLRVLIVEDSEPDTELLLRELRRGGYDPQHVRVETAEAMRAEMTSKEWHIIFCDFSMPRFNAFDALALLCQIGLDIPFIIVSGTIGEDRAVTAMKAGAHDYILKDNLKRLIPAVERELREARMRQDRRAKEEEIERLAYFDPVTGLPNRFYFQKSVSQAIKSAQGKHPLALLLMDLQRFKDVNDTLGHHRGDALLQQVGMRLKSALFTPDIVARLGGDEFGILLPRLTATEDIEMVVEKLQDILMVPFMVEGIPIAVEGCTGVAIMPDHGDDPDRLLQLADIAMYRAKNLASNYALYSPEYDRHSPEKLGLMAELRDGIDQNQLVLHYQPKIEILSGSVVGEEALVRWQHPRRGFLSPDQFVPTAEYTGLIGPLTYRVLNDALNYCRDSGNASTQLPVSVNLSARSLHDHRLLESVWTALQARGVEPHQLTLEITESAIVLDPKRAEESLTGLNRMGIRLSIDDFGTGYTSIGSLKRLPIDEIKIDKSFVTGILTDRDDATIVRSVIDLGHNLGLRVVAEGVETKEIFDALASFGCDEVQGYFIARPQDGASMNDWLRESSWKTDSGK